MNKTASRPTLVLDLDGTLVDTAPDLLDSLNHVLDIASLPPARPEELRRFVGMGGKVMIERAFAAQNRKLEQDHLAELLTAFLSHYTAAIPGRSLLFDGAADAIARFRAAGWTLAVCTNKYESLAVKLIEALGHAQDFAAICGQDTFAWRKPDPRHLLLTIDEVDGTPDNAVMVGDSRADIDTAKAAGVPVVAVDFGYTDLHVSRFEPSVVISHFDELTVELAERLVAAARP